MHRFIHSYDALLSTHFNVLLPTVLWRHIRNKSTHLYSFLFNAVLAHIDHDWLFSGYLLSKPSWILFPLTIKIFKDDENLLPKIVAHTKLLYWSGLNMYMYKYVTSLVESAIMGKGIHTCTDL